MEFVFWDSPSGGKGSRTLKTKEVQPMEPTLYAVMKFRPLHEPPDDQREKMNKIIALQNRIFQPYLASRFILSGFEGEGVLYVQEAPRFLHLLQLIDLEMHPLRFQFTLGVGTIATGLKRRQHENTIEIKGPAVTAAKKAFKDLAGGDQDVAVRFPSPFLTRLTNSLFAVESDLRNNWSIAHRETIKLARQGLTQIEMAEILGITQAAVSQRLKHARWERYGQICRMLWELLSHVRWRTLLPWDLQKTLGKPE
jgi:predicted XRE-type DNA-binding protein